MDYLTPQPIIDKNDKKCNIYLCDKKRGLVVDNYGKWCKAHYEYYFGNKPFVPPKKDNDIAKNKSKKNTKWVCKSEPKPKINPIILETKHICHAYDCKMYTQLISKYNGEWCDVHYGEISELRKIIGAHLGSYEEVVARFNEIKLRKFQDEGHVFFAFKLLKKLKGKKSY
jgi:hypothetical protein